MEFEEVLTVHVKIEKAIEMKSDNVDSVLMILFKGSAVESISKVRCFQVELILKSLANLVTIILYQQGICLKERIIQEKAAKSL